MLDEKRRRLLQKTRIDSRVFEQRTNRLIVAPVDPLERGSGAFDGVFGGFAAAAKDVEHRLDERAEGIRRHRRQVALVDAREITLVHFCDELLDGTHQHIGRYIPEVGHAPTVIPVGRQLLEAAENEPS